jgi:hypothetical protein
MTSHARMVAYYAALIVIGVASLWLGVPAALTFGGGYVVAALAGLVLRLRRHRREEAWVVVALAILSLGQALALWLGESPDGGLAEILTAARLGVAPLMMVDYAALLRSGRRA